MPFTDPDPGIVLTYKLAVAQLADLEARAAKEGARPVFAEAAVHVRATLARLVEEYPSLAPAPSSPCD